MQGGLLFFSSGGRGRAPPITCSTSFFSGSSSSPASPYCGVPLSAAYGFPTPSPPLFGRVGSLPPNCFSLRPGSQHCVLLGRHKKTTRPSSRRRFSVPQVFPLVENDAAWPRSLAFSVVARKAPLHAVWFLSPSASPTPSPFLCHLLFPSLPLFSTPWVRHGCRRGVWKESPPASHLVLVTLLGHDPCFTCFRSRANALSS